MFASGSLGLLLFFTCVCFIQGTRRLPSYITPCHRNDPDLSGCVKRVVKVVQPHLAKGIPEFAVPPMEPLFLPRIELNTGQGFNLTFRDVHLKHASEFVIEDVHLDLSRDHLELRLTFPILNGSCQYDVQGRILILTLEGTGPAWINCTNVHAVAVADFARVPGKNGKTYIKQEKIKLKTDLGRPSLWFEGLFPDKELNQQTNRVLNENIEQILTELEAVVDEAIGQFCGKLMERILERFTFDELFPL